MTLFAATPDATLVGQGPRSEPPRSPVRVGLWPIVPLLGLGAVAASLLAAPAAVATPTAPLTAIVPASAPAGSPPVTLRIRANKADLPPVATSGAKAVTGYAILWGGLRTLPATLAENPAGNAVTWTATVPVGALAIPPAPKNLRGAYCYADGTCEPVTATGRFQVVAAPRPTIASLSPTGVAAGSAGFNLVVRGEHLRRFSTVTFAGQEMETRFVNSRRVDATIPASEVSIARGRNVRIRHVVRYGGPSAIVKFNVLDIPVPAINKLQPNRLPAGSKAVTLTVTGSGFSRASIIRFRGTRYPTTFVSKSRLTARIPAAALVTPGDAVVIVLDSPGGKTPQATLRLTSPTPPPPPIPDSIVPLVPESPPEINDVGTDAVLPGDILRVAGQHFGREQDKSTILIGDAPAEIAGEWGDARLDVRVPDIGAGASTLSITTALGTASAPITIGEEPAAPPIANPVLLPAADGAVRFDASTAIDPVTGGSAPGDAQANASGLSGIASILWRFGDGGTSTETAPVYTYPKAGTYTPTVTVTSTSGASTTTSAGTVTVSRASSGRLAPKLPPVNFSIPSRVVFDAGRSDIRPESRSYLVRLAKLVRQVGRRTEVGGHSDSLGAFSANQEVSAARARAVRSFLVEEGKVPPGLLSAVGYGETRPVDDNATALGRQRNRRVELRITRGDTPIRLTSRQLLINQRISQAAIARATALEGRLMGGLGSEDIRDGSLTPQDFGPSVTITGESSLEAQATAVSRPLAVKSPKRSGKKLTVSDRQLLINQRISQAAVRRVNRLDALLDVGLTGAAIRDGELGSDDLVPELQASVAGPAPDLGEFVLPALRVAKADAGKVRATQEQLIINQRVSQAAIRRLNLAIARFEKGLTGADFRDGSLGSGDLAK